jgi:isopenicillin-N epimerase
LTVPTLPSPSDLAKHWTLDSDVVFLNHGSFGACPRAVLERQSELRARLEREPVRWFIETLDPLMDEARAAAAAFVSCPTEDLVFVPNATQAVATVLLNLEPTLKPGDEMLATVHEYPACLNNLRRIAARTGAKLVNVAIPFPLTSPDQVTQAVLSAVTPRTRLALVSQVTSPSGLILPVEQIVPDLERRGIPVILDGAHAPGMTPRADLSLLRPSYYTANFHKWVCSPKGSAILHVRSDRQRDFRPWCLSNNAEKPKPAASTCSLSSTSSAPWTTPPGSRSRRPSARCTRWSPAAGPRSCSATTTWSSRPAITSAAN